MRSRLPATKSRARRAPLSRAHRFAVAGAAAILAFTGGVVAAEELRIVGDVVQRPAAEAFFAQPPGAADGVPGTLVKSEVLAGVPFDTRGWRLMYRSTDVHGDPVVVTGVLVVPLGAAPDNGRTVVSWGHPTTGSAPGCAPSAGPDPTFGIEGLRSLLDRGYAVVATDYAGMGTAGPDSYLVGETEGNNVLDAVRAAQHIRAAAASDRVVLWGHSQGGQAVLFAAQQAAAYAPELQIEAVATAAPAADLRALMQTHLDDISGVTIGSYAFSAFAKVYDEPVERILTPQAVALLPRMNALCLLTNIPELHAIGQPLVGHFMTADPTTTQPWAGLLAENSAGAVPFSAPLFVAQGLSDELVRPADTDRFVRHESAIGIHVTEERISFATHGTIAYLAVPAMIEWLDAHVGRGGDSLP
ncbi:alpha/beta fold hydrolase [Microbacterium sp.]|uniref:alpha/beta fold hydrolase n=1 Tax=Microbacterium sp. TaxID=51671 RepID=UPI000A8EB9C6|nr:alpha/beta fold hydrolase [Microbacterium sp.]MBN9193223.1 alpha/beta fold hydrolase [Microbacterium sp.]